MNTRIKKIREKFTLTQEEFGKKIGAARNTIANYESGNRSPSNAVILSICREFKINEEWLRYGTGSMYIAPSREQEIATITSTLLKEETESFKYRLIKALCSLGNADWEMLEKLAINIANDSSNSTALPSNNLKQQIDAKVEEYRQELELEARQTAESSAYDKEKKNA